MTVKTLEAEIVRLNKVVEVLKGELVRAGALGWSVEQVAKDAYNDSEY